MNHKASSSGRSNQKPLVERKLRIKIVGVGGAGVNALDRMVMDRFDDISLLSVNTDAQALATSVVHEKLQIGESLTLGLGAGGDPQTGRFAALESKELLRDKLKGCDLIFMAAGMGGGTGTGAGPVIARIAREEGSLVLALITLPFTHEGKRRMEVAREGLCAMQEAADAVVCIPNDKLLDLSSDQTSVMDAFRPTDEFLSHGVHRIWSMLTRTGMINIDFADLRSVLRRHDGETLLGFGEGTGPNKVEQALEGVFRSPLLSDASLLAKANAALIGVTHGPDLKMSQFHGLLKELTSRLGSDVACKQGVDVDENYGDRLSVILIASTGKPMPEEESGKKSIVESGGSSSAESMIQNASVSLFADGPTIQRASRKNEGAYEFIGASSGLRQETLKLDEATRGLFERVERTVVNGQDLDRPTFIRRGIVLKKIKASSTGL